MSAPSHSTPRRAYQSGDTSSHSNFHIVKLTGRARRIPSSLPTMKHQFCIRLVMLSALLVLGTGLFAREWTDSAGRKIEAEILGIEQGSAVVMLIGKQRAALPVAKLSATDQVWLKEWAKDKSPAQQLPLPVWPETVLQPEIKLTGGKSKDGKFIFHSTHYDFACDAEVSASVINDFATVAEGTLRLIYSLPLRFPPLDGRTFGARICQSRSAYERAGGPPGSAGVFILGNMSGQGVLLVPFESLGIEKFAGQNTKSYSYRSTVLIHEMTHQTTAELLLLMPKWVAEGLAEYAGNMTYRNGVFYLGARDRVQALRQRLESYDKLSREQDAQVMASPSNKPPSPVNATPTRPLESWIMRPSELVKKTDRDWGTNVRSRAAHAQLHRMYLSSMFLVHYYLHMADNGEARRIRLYFDELTTDSTWFRAQGRNGEPAPSYLRSDSSIEEVRSHYARLLFSENDLAALDADFRAKYIALGFRIPEWK